MTHEDDFVLFQALLPTRRFFNVLIDDHHVVVRVVCFHINNTLNNLLWTGEVVRKLMLRNDYSVLKHRWYLLKPSYTLQDFLAVASKLKATSRSLCHTCIKEAAYEKCKQKLPKTENIRAEKDIIVRNLTKEGMSEAAIFQNYTARFFN